MAKRKRTVASEVPDRNPDLAVPGDGQDGLVEMRFRVDKSVHAKIKDSAEKAGISLNQLASGVIEAAAERMCFGFPRLKGKEEFVVVERREKCVFFGQPGDRYTQKDYEAHLEYWHENGCDPDGEPNPENIGKTTMGYVWFILDYSGRPVKLSVDRI